MLVGLIFLVVIIEARPISAVEGLEPGTQDRARGGVGNRRGRGCRIGRAGWRIERKKQCAACTKQRHRRASTDTSETDRACAMSIALIHVPLSLLSKHRYGIIRYLRPRRHFYRGRRHRGQRLSSFRRNGPPRQTAAWHPIWASLLCPTSWDPDARRCQPR